MATVTGQIVFDSPVYSEICSFVSVVLSRSSEIHWCTAEIFVVTIRVFVLSISIIAIPTIVFPAPHGSTIVPKPVPGPRSPTIDCAASLWYLRISNFFPESVVFLRENSSGSPSTSGTSSFTGQPSLRRFCFIVPRSVRRSLKQ